MDDDATRFEEAWGEFEEQCADSEMPEATYQAWFAHFLIGRFGLRRVAREPSFGIKRFEAGPPDYVLAPEWRAKLPRQNVRLDIVISRTPTLRIPQWITREREQGVPGGVGLLQDLTVISELKVASTSYAGLNYSEICRDIWKLSALLAEARHLKLEPLPTAFVCILDNRKGIDSSHLARWLGTLAGDPNVRILPRRLE